MNEQIRSLQEREDLSFEEAQYYLKKASGDIDKAVYLIQKKRNSWYQGAKAKIKAIILGFWRYRLRIYRQDRTFINLPFFAFLILLLVLDLGGIGYGYLSLILLIYIIISRSTLCLSNVEAEEEEYQAKAESRKLDTRMDTSSQRIGPRPDRTKAGKEIRSEVVAGDQARTEDYSEIIIK